MFLALVNAGLTLVQRYYSARIGEGLIFDMRTALFDHVQRQPLSFFTRTQTGSLMSRMNNDVIGAQQAVTNTLGTVFSNVSSVVVTLAFMLALEWRLTLLTLVDPAALHHPGEAHGPEAAAAHPREHAAQRVDEQHHRRAVQRGRRAGREAVRQARPRVATRSPTAPGAVRDIGVQTAMYSRVLFAALGLVAAVGTAIVYFVGGNLAISGTIGVGTIAAFAVYVSQIYQPLTQLANARVDVLTALVSFERVFEVLDFPPLIADRARRRSTSLDAGRAASSSTTCGSATRRRRSSSIPSLEEAHRRHRPRRRERVDPARRQLHRRARASSWRWSGRRARARPPPRCSSPASTT